MSLGARQILWAEGNTMYPHDRPSPPVRGITIVCKTASNGVPGSSYFLLEDAPSKNKVKRERVVVQGVRKGFVTLAGQK